MFEVHGEMYQCIIGWNDHGGISRESTFNGQKNIIMYYIRKITFGTYTKININA